MAEQRQGAWFAAWTFYIFKFKCPKLPLPFVLLSFLSSFPSLPLCFFSFHLSTVSV